ncbi:MAG: tRNA pseudouridine(55) synthase TruB [Clostridia bacterium]|nr:tRNA pseudouridine(55) synthase TruB [Clostridia bacterium]
MGLYKIYSPENIFLGLGEVKQDGMLWVKRLYIDN